MTSDAEAAVAPGASVGTGAGVGAGDPTAGPTGGSRPPLGEPRPPLGEPRPPLGEPAAPAGDRERLPADEGTFDLAAHRCFACGDLNARGIRMEIHVEPDRSWSDLVLDPAFQGWEGVAHGGILATLLDEAMAWAIASREAFAMTARMSIEYRRPVRVATAVRVEGRVIEARRRLLRAEAVVLQPETGEVCARAEGVYLVIPERQQDELRSRYRFAGATDGPGGERRWRVRQTLPAVEPTGAVEPDAAAAPWAATASKAGSRFSTDGRPGDTPGSVAAPTNEADRRTRRTDERRGPMSGADPAPASATTAAAVAFVDAHRPAAVALGRRLGDLLGDPEAFGAELDAGLASLADPVFAEAMAWVAPGVRGVAGVRGPLVAAVESGVRRAARGVGPAPILALADHASRSEVAEARWVAIHLMDRIVAADPERAWQLMRRTARSATDWITVDTLASPYARGVLLEPYRWAELEQVVFSPSSGERRLAGSTIARMPFVDRTLGRRPEIAVRGLEVVGSLIGDASPDVQKALSWALRSLVLADREAVTRFCDEQAERAAASGDGARAWVVRDALPKLETADAAAIRERVAGIRRRPGAPSTSAAAETAARFGELPSPDSHPMAPFP